MPYDNKWLAKHTEEIVEPDLPIIDPHHHFWQQSAFGRYMLDDLWSDTESGHNIERTVFLECHAEYYKDGPEDRRSLGETNFVAGLAAETVESSEHDVHIAAIVGHVDLTLGARVSEILEAHLELSPDLFRGIRQSASWDASDELGGSGPDPRLYEGDSFREGFAELLSLGLSFDAWSYFTQLPQLADLARAFPDTTVVVDHLGGPLGIGPYAVNRNDVFGQWQENITELSKCENVALKLGGLGMPHVGNGWHEQDTPPGSQAVAAAYKPYCDHAIEQFGPHRCMFESNFPVDKLSVSYSVLWNAFKVVTANFSADEKAALFYRTAESVYRL